MTLCAMVTGLLSACYAYDVTSLMDDEANLVLRIHLGQSRTARVVGDNPTGGEWGDGTRPGEHHENDIERITLFCYNHPNGINAPDDTPVTKLTYVDNIGFHPTANETSTEISLKSVPYEHHLYDNFVVCVNCEDFGVNTLGQLRDRIPAYSVQASADGVKANYTDFVMANENASHFNGGQGTADDPNVIEVSVERVVGRLDFCINGSVIDGNTLRYDARDGDAETKVGETYVSHVRAFNVMQPSQTPYLIKRMASSNTATNHYLAPELKPAQEYVVEPRTWLKNTPNTSLWYGPTSYKEAVTKGDSWFRAEDRVHVSLSGSGFTDGVSVDTSDPTDIQHYYVLDYANENTMTPENTTSLTTTGMALKAIYKPEKVYKSLDALGQPVIDSDYSKGTSFWRYRPTVAIYDETQALYFSTATAAESYRLLHPEEQGVVEAYPNGQCYYIVYLRHDNSAKTPYTDMMEFGTVRNNIYRLQVEFTGPGYSTIPLETETEPEGLKPYIFVRKWYYIEHPEIVI